MSAQIQGAHVKQVCMLQPLLVNVVTTPFYGIKTQIWRAICVWCERTVRHHSKTF